MQQIWDFFKYVKSGGICAAGDGACVDTGGAHAHFLPFLKCGLLKTVCLGSVLRLKLNSLIYALSFFKVTSCSSEGLLITGHLLTLAVQIRLCSVFPFELAFLPTPYLYFNRILPKVWSGSATVLPFVIGLNWITVSSSGNRCNYTHLCSLAALILQLIKTMNN